jgi:hypothetical protein
MIKKIDFITEYNDLLLFINKGVNIFGFPFNPNDYVYNIPVEPEELILIKNTSQKDTPKFSLIIEEEEDLEYLDPEILNLFDYLQFSENYIYFHSVLSKSSYLNLLNQAPHLKVIVSCCHLDHDDPTIILENYRQAWAEKNPFAQCIAWYQLEVLSDIGWLQRSRQWEQLKEWSHLKDVTDVLQIEKVQRATEELPVTLALDFTSENIQEIQHTFPLGKGIHFNLGEESETRHYYNWSSFAEIEEALSGLV